MPEFFEYFSRNQCIIIHKKQTHFKEKNFIIDLCYLSIKQPSLTLSIQKFSICVKLYVPEFFEYFSRNLRIKIHKKQPLL